MVRDGSYASRSRESGVMRLFFGLGYVTLILAASASGLAFVEVAADEGVLQFGAYDLPARFDAEIVFPYRTTIGTSGYEVGPAGNVRIDVDAMAQTGVSEICTKLDIP